jgi:hypothetical protein
MPLNASVVDAELTADNRLQILAQVSATGFDNIAYEGQMTVSGLGDIEASDTVEFSGQVGPGAGDEYMETFDLGLSESDFPGEVLVTLALDDGTQDQVTVEISGGAAGQPPADESMLTQKALLGVGALGVGLYLATRD